MSKKEPIVLEDLERVELFQEPALLAEYRVDKSTLPNGLYYYELRHGDDDSVPATVEKSVGANFFGAVITADPLDFKGKDYIEITGEDWGYDDGECDYSVFGLEDDFEDDLDDYDDEDEDY